MTTTVTTETTARPVRLSRANKIGLVLALLLGVSDVIGPWTTPSGSGEGNGPPSSVLYVDALIGLVTVVAAVIAWRTGSRVAARVVAGSRILSAISALPAFFVGGVPAALVVLAAAGILFTLLTCWLVLKRPAPQNA
jgi:NADPH:quinone reductase-like Zn-dependent oxidoreductase